MNGTGDKRTILRWEEEVRLRCLLKVSKQKKSTLLPNRGGKPRGGREGGEGLRGKKSGTGA